MTNKREIKTTVLIKHHLKQLRLPTMASECDSLADQAARDNQDHLAYLLKLTERELIERERKSAERRLKAARFPAHKTLDQFDFTAQPTINKPLVAQLAKLDLLVLDELGYVPASKAGAELLFDVIATAYERNSIVVTTNLPFENWPEVLGNQRLTGAALDRLTHRCHIIETKGESYRLQDAKRRAGKKPPVKKKSA